jgi:hypothetical protein
MIASTTVEARRSARGRSSLVVTPWLRTSLLARRYRYWTDIVEKTPVTKAIQGRCRDSNTVAVTYGRATIPPE